MSQIDRFQTTVKKSDDKEALELAASLLKEGRLVAVPTETVYGLAANALNENAVESIFEAKGRPSDNPLIVHIADIEMWKTLVKELTTDALALAKIFWPGPLTIILPKSDVVPMKTTGGLDTVAVRMPNQKDTLELIRIAKIPLAAPSANLSGLPSTTTAEHCLKDLGGKIPLILDGGACSVGIESTVVSLCGEKPVVLRPGKITPAQIKKTLGKEVLVADAVIHPLKDGEKVSSPGMKYKHYSPKAKVVLIKGSIDGFLKELRNSPKGTYALVFEGEEKFMPEISFAYGREHNSDSQAQGIFSMLRLMDDKGAKTVLVRCPDEEEALGVYNRLLRASAFEVRKV